MTLERIKRWTTRGALVVAMVTFHVFAYGHVATAAPLVRITGSVTTETGAPVADVSISATDPGGTAVRYGPVLTGADGTYALEMEAGTFDFHFDPSTASGLNSVVRGTLNVQSDQTINVQLAPAPPPPPVTHSLSGVVSTFEGLPVNNLRVLLGGVSSRSNVGGPGGYSVAVPVGVYSDLSATNGLFAMFLQGSLPYPHSATIAADPGSPSFDLRTNDITQNLRMPPTTTITATVLDTTGSPVAIGKPIEATGVSSADRSFAFVPTGPETYRFTETSSSANTGPNGITQLSVFTGLTFAPGSICVRTVSGFVSTYCNTTPVNTDNGAASVTLIQPSPPTHTFSGVARDGAGNPVPGLRIGLSGSDTGSQADGRFAITKSPGRYSLTVRAGGPASGPLNVPRVPGTFVLSGPGNEIDLASNDVTSDILLPQATTVTANIKDVNGNPAPNVPVTFSGIASGHPAISGSNTLFSAIQSSDHGDYRSDSNGTVTFTLFRNTTLPANTGVCATFAVSPRDICNATQLSTTNGDVTITLTQQPPTPVYTFSGTARDADNRPVPGVTIGLGNGTSRTDANGAFTMTKDPGTYTFVVNGGGAAAGPLTVPGMPGFFNFNQPDVSLTASTHRELRFPTSTSATVTVKDINGNPLTGAYVSTRGRFPSGYPLVVGDPSVFNGEVWSDDQTDAQGNFVTTVFRGLTYKPGDICVTHGNFHQCNTTALNTINGPISLIFQQQPPIPLTPTGLSAHTPTNTPPSLSWNPVPGATNYLIYRGDELLGSTTTANFIDTGLATDGMFTYVISASNGGGISPPSNPFTVTYDTTAPATTGTADRPASATGWHNGPVTITWSSTDPAPSSGPPTSPNPTVATAEGANQVITSAPSCDPAGNCAPGQHILSIDNTAPGITVQAVPDPNADGWNNQDVTVTFACTDALSGVADCSSPITLTSEGNSQSASGTAKDHAGNTASITATGIKIDKTAPTLATPNWTTNPKPVGTPTQPVTTTLSVSAIDTLSGIQAGEYFIGPDPGIGHATTMTHLNGVLTATFGADLPVGVHDIGIRAKDIAGNWSLVSNTMLVVVDPAGAGITGKNKKDLFPSLSNGDVLPGLVQNGQTDPADYGFTVDFRNGAMDLRNDFHFSYTTGTRCQGPNPVNCHQLTLNATTFDWLVIDQTNNSRGHFQGTATVTVDGVATTNPFTLEGIDGDRLTPTADDHLILKIYPPDTNPSNATRIYQASGSIAKGNSVRIR